MVQVELRLGTCPISAAGPSAALPGGNEIERCGVLVLGIMLILSVPWDFRLLWAALTITAKLYIICLLAASAYSTYCLTRITVRLRQIAKREKAEMVLVANMTAKTQTLREFHTMLFLLFGLCCSNELFNTLRGIQNSAVSLSAARFDVFEPVIAFAFFVFAVLLVLHGFRWAVAHGLQTASIGD